MMPHQIANLEGKDLTQDVIAALHGQEQDRRDDIKRKAEAAALAAMPPGMG